MLSLSHSAAKNLLKKNWEDFFVRNSKNLPPSTERDDHEGESDQSTPYLLNLQTVEGVVGPPERSQKETEYELRLTLFDITYKRFLGRTWTGPRKTVKAKGAKKALLQYNTPVYFQTSLADANLLLVVEIVGIIADKKGMNHSLTCGWSAVRIFQNADLIDTASGTPAPLKRADVYHGSPRALFFLDDNFEGSKALTLVADCQVCYSIRTHKYMEKVLHLMPENIIFSGNDVIPGMAVVEGGDNFRKPKPLKKIPVTLDKIILNLYPSLEKFEEELCKDINSDRLRRENVQSDKSTVTVTERRLQIGVHNGWGYVEKPQIVMLDSDDFSRAGLRGSFKRGKMRPAGSRESLQSALQVKNKVTLQSLVDDPLFSVVFLVEYIVTVPIASQDRKLNGSMRRSQTQSIYLRWGAWTPNFSEPVSEVSLTLQGGPAPNADDVLVYKNPDIQMSDKEASQKSQGKMRFVFKIKREGGSRPLSPMSGSVPSDSARLPNQADLMRPPFSKGQFPSMQSLPSQSGTEASLMPEMHAGLMGRPPPGRSPRTPRMQFPQQQGMPPMQGSLPSMSPMPMQHDPTGLYPGMQGYPGQQGYPGVHGYPGMHMYPGMGGFTGPPRFPADSEKQEMEEVSFTPVHAPIIPTAPVTRSSQGLSRAAYAYLYHAGFTDIRDRHGEPPTAVDPQDHVTLNQQRESSDALQCNEISIQFLAMSKIISQYPSSSTPLPKSVFFTFQFYRYPPVTTERLMLVEPEKRSSAGTDVMPAIFMKIKDGQVSKEDSPGWMTRYTIDPEFLKPGEGPLFIKHLFQQTLHIDVWDGDSLLLIGSCSVELKFLLRGGREAVQVSHELDVVSSEYNEESAAMTGDLTRSGSVRPVGVANHLRGRLHLRLASVGHPVDKSMKQVATIPFERSKVVVQEDGSGAFLGGSLSSALTNQTTVTLANLRQKRSFLASHMTESDQELATALFSHKDRSILQESNKLDPKRQRKLARMQAMRQTLDQENERNSTRMLKKEEKIQRTRDLKTIEVFRNRTKKDSILHMLQSVITTQHVVYPSFGSAEFFEFELQNPYNLEHTISIQWDDPELSIITVPREWRHFKRRFGAENTPMEENMFNNNENKDTNVSGLQIFLKPKERVHVPFKYQSFTADHTVPPQGPSSGHHNWRMTSQQGTLDQILQSKNIKVHFRTQDNKPIAVLSLNVEPQPHIIDQTFRFQQPEQTFLKKSIRLPPFHSMKGTDNRDEIFDQLFVKCSDESIICESKKVVRRVARKAFTQPIVAVMTFLPIEDLRRVCEEFINGNPEFCAILF